MSFISKIHGKVKQAMHDDQKVYDITTHKLPKCEISRVHRPGNYVYVAFEVPKTFSEDGRASITCDQQRIQRSNTCVSGMPEIHYTHKSDHWQPEQRDLIELVVKRGDEFVKKTVSFEELNHQVELAQKQKEARAEKYTKQALAEMGVEMDETTEEILFQK